MPTRSRENREPPPPPRFRVPPVHLDWPERLAAPAVHTRQRTSPRFSTSSDGARKAIARSGLVAVDLETKGLHPHESADADIGAVILKANGKRFLLRSLPSWWPEVLEDGSTVKVLHNAKFDLMWMIEHCPDTDPETGGQRHARGIRDTMLRSQIANRYRTRSGAAKAGCPEAWVPNDLKTCLSRYLDVSIGKEIDHSVTDWTGDWSSDMIDYMLQDIDYLLPLEETLEQTLTDQGQLRAAENEEGVVFGTAWMTLNGMLPDQDLWEQQISLWRQQHSEVLKDLLHLWPGVTNFNSPKQLKETSEAVLGGYLQNTRKATLKQLSVQHEPVRVLLDQRHLGTRLKNWGPTFLRLYVCECGRFHPSWNQIGTETARFSCSRPNAQQFPRDPSFRRMIVAAPGHQLCSLDYSAIEVVAAAVYSQDTNLLKACKSGDPHLATARMIAGDPTIQKDDPRRQNAKIANFGLLFAGGVGALITQARDLFDVILSEQEARKIFNEYFALYGEMFKMRQLAYDRCQGPLPVLEVENAIGFTRYLEKNNRKPTSILNTRIQSDAGAGIKRSFHYLNEYGLLPFLIGQIHDELLFEFPDELVEWGEKTAMYCMRKGMHDVLGAYAPVTVDPHTAPWWQ